MIGLARKYHRGYSWKSTENIPADEIPTPICVSRRYSAFKDEFFVGSFNNRLNTPNNSDNSCWNLLPNLLFPGGSLFLRVSGSTVFPECLG